MGKTKYDFSGQVAVITGGSHGIGRGVAEALGEAGAQVAILDIDEATAKEVANQIASGGGRASALHCDATQTASVEAAFAAVLEQYGRIDLLLNSAGGFTEKFRIDQTPDEEWDRLLALNLKSTFLCTRAAYPAFIKQQSGAIVNVGSVAGVFGMGSLNPAYAAAKAGVHQLTRTSAAELAEYGARANTLVPGTTVTERVSKLHGETMQQIAANNPMGRVAEVDDMTGAALFLLSDEARYLTGKTLTIDGGMLIV